jgi:NTP pyrophosphatase (non-canonical NTP hydrolase)
VNKIDREDIEMLKRYEKNGVSDFVLYQQTATQSAVYPGQGTPLGLAYVALKLNGEAGELAEHVGKAARDEGFFEFFGYADFVETGNPLGASLAPERRELLIKEVGDVLWYLSAACNELGISLSAAAITNLEKLADRQERNVLRGSGDER